jgi:hypothetical protein
MSVSVSSPRSRIARRIVSASWLPMPFEALTPGERLTRNEQLIAIERTLVRGIFQIEGCPSHSSEEIAALHKLFSEKLLELANTGGVSFGPFQTMISIQFGKSDEWSGGHGDSLIPYHFAQLLKKFPSSVLRCPHCKKLFLSSRRNAYHCSRECQSRAAAQKQRSRNKDLDQHHQSLKSKRISSPAKRKEK